jgi:hypothetical protein
MLMEAKLALGCGQFSMGSHLVHRKTIHRLSIVNNSLSPPLRTPQPPRMPQSLRMLEGDTCKEPEKSIIDHAATTEDTPPSRDATLAR